ncbi:DMT family transporter [Geopsychrobacter electrodiphilus]|uniref:DMT family transporter n=1 Tax=Geopsychrobacter electrodiphilus TaxID=225196 RepID=UPI0003798E52|nr:DMT family transporter [Geopsychrobacter electrodiphilus]
MKTYLKLFAVAFFWGGTFVAGRFLAGQAQPVSAAFFRFAIASVLLLLVVRLREGGLPRLDLRQAVAVSALGLTGIFAYNLFFFNGLTLIGAGRAALIIALNPVAITLCSALVYKEVLPLSRIIGIPISVLGAMVVITRGHPAMIFSGGVGRGELLMSGCVLSWTLYSIIGKTAMRGLSPLAAVCWSSLTGTLFLLVPALIYGSLPEALTFSWSVWASIGYLGLFGTVIGFLWYFEGIQKIGPSRAAVFINFVPVNGVLLGTLLLGESLNLSLLAGGGLVVCGAYLANAPKPLFWRNH